LQDDYARAIKKLEQERSTTKDEEANRLLSARIQIIKDEAKESSELYGRHKEGIGDQIRLLQSAKMIEAARLQDQQNMVKAIEDQISRQQQLGDLMVSANDKLVDTKFAGSQQGRSPLEQKMASIQEEARKAALEAGRALSAGFEGMDLTTAQAQELANGLDQIAQKYKAIADEQTRQLDASRSWDLGWKTAFDNYMDNATNAAMRAGEVFNSITSNMSSAIDKFVETGKFSFGDFARSIIQDLIKIELKAQATKLLGAIGGGGGIFGAIGSIFGFANGGNPPINKPSIVGEKGPELFIPKTAGTIVPNGGFGGGGGSSAPATNNVTNNYNISAIDSKSVAQFFAENRKTMLGTMQLAQKELPYGR
jgi:lambda family phage tail tape measure protein